jgi:hypothetical protein
MYVCTLADRTTAAVLAAAATTLVVGVIILTSVTALIGTVRRRKRRKTVNLLQGEHRPQYANTPATNLTIQQQSIDILYK